MNWCLSFQSDHSSQLGQLYPPPSPSGPGAHTRLCQGGHHEQGPRVAAAAGTRAPHVVRGRRSVAAARRGVRAGQPRRGGGAGCALPDSRIVPASPAPPAAPPPRRPRRGGSWRPPRRPGLPFLQSPAAAAPAAAAAALAAPVPAPPVPAAPPVPGAPAAAAPQPAAARAPPAAAPAAPAAARAPAPFSCSSPLLLARLFLRPPLLFLGLGISGASRCPVPAKAAPRGAARPLGTLSAAGSGAERMEGAGRRLLPHPSNRAARAAPSRRRALPGFQEPARGTKARSRAGAAGSGRKRDARGQEGKGGSPACFDSASLTRSGPAPPVTSLGTRPGRAQQVTSRRTGPPA